jgi:hydrogenase nickel incorporation protein HypA/HybF
LELAGEQLQKTGCTQIHRIRLRVGLLSGVMPEALRFAFDVLKVGTSAENAALEIERTPGLFSCPACRLDLRLDSIQFLCSECGGLLTLREGGANLELAQMEIS